MDEKSCPNRVGQLFSCRFSAGGFRRRSLERQIARGACPPMVESRGGRRIAVELRVSAAGRSFAPRRPAVRVPLGRAPSQAPTRIGVSCAAGSASQRPAGRSLRARRPAARVPLGCAPSQAPTRIGVSCAAGSASQRPAGRSLRVRRPAARVPLGRAPSQAPTRIGVVLRRRFGLVEAGGPKPPHAEARILSTRALRRLRPEHESRVSAAGRSFRFRTARQGVRRRVRGSPRCPWPCVRRRRPPNRNRGTRAVRPDRSAGR